MHDCWWIEGTTCQEDHPLTPHYNLKDMVWLKSCSLFTEIGWLVEMWNQFWAGNNVRNTAHISFQIILGKQIRYICPAVLTAGYSTGCSLFESVFVSRHRQTSAFSFVLLFESPRIPHMCPPWTSYRWPWTWRRRPRGGRWPCCPSAACARRMQRFGKVQSSAHHHTPCQWWLAIKDHHN